MTRFNWQGNFHIEIWTFSIYIFPLKSDCVFFCLISFDCFYLFLLISSGDLTVEQALDLTLYLDKEKDWLPWETTLHHLQYVISMLTHAESYPKFKVCSTKLNLQVNDDERHLYILHRYSAHSQEV